jgi:hypothetical protein
MYLIRFSQIFNSCAIKCVINLGENNGENVPVHAKEAYGRVGVWFHCFVTAALGEAKG